MIESPRRMRLAIPLLSLLPFLPSCTEAAPATATPQVPVHAVAGTVAIPDTPTGRHFPDFLDAYNSGDFEMLRTFFERFENGSPEGLAAYWKGVHNEFGPVTLEQVDTTGDRHRYWVRGRLTRAWSRFVVGVREDGPPLRLGAIGVSRGVRPPGWRRAGSAPPSQLPDTLHAWLGALEEGGHFSGVVAVARDGEIVFEGAYGEADARHTVPNRLDTRFPTASMTKMLTAVAVLQLVERGEVGLDDPLGRWVPEYPEPIASTVTVRHLLTHTSGIEIDDHAPFNRDVERARTVEELLEAQLAHLDSMNQGPVADFRLPDGFDYTNEGYDLLGVVVGRASDSTWREYLSEHVLTPAGMTRTGFDRDVPVEGLATGYTRGSDHPRGERMQNHFLLAPFARPAGNVFSTARDMVRFLEAVRGGRLLGPELVRSATTPQVEWSGDETYGFGFAIEGEGGVPYWGHSGSSPGVAARGHVHPDLGWTVVVLANFDDSARHVLAHLHELIGVE